MISKKIFQIYHDKSKVATYVKENIMKLNPEYKYILLDFEDGKKIIKKNFNTKIASIICFHIDNLQKYCHKSDLLRYCLLYIYGGVYIDIDMKPIIPFDEIFVDEQIDIVCSFGQGGGFAPYKKLQTDNKYHFPLMANGFLMSKKKSNNFFRILINQIINSRNFLPRHTLNCENMFKTIKYLCSKKNIELKPYINLKIKPNIYIYRENYIYKKFYIIDHNYNIIINSNKHDY